MTAADVEARDDARVAEIGRYQVLADPPRRDLVALAEIAAQVAGVPMATINLITDRAQHQVATAGFDPSICSREDSMCNGVFLGGAPVVVPDASTDPRFCHNPFVTGAIGDVRFYASHPLRTPAGVPIGTLCVFDVVPRTLTAQQAATLWQLADRVVDVLELELRTRELASAVEELEDVRAELTRSNEVLAAFAGQVSHDLANPLAAVRMALDLLAEDDGVARSLLLDKAGRGVSRMQGLVEGLLDYARVGGELTRVPVDLARVVSEVCDDLGVALDGVTVEVSRLPVLVGDPVQLHAVLQNLLSNAAKFVRPGADPHVEVHATRTAQGWRIEVQDDGPGVPADQRERVFEPLARADASVPGSGIGLATCRRIIEAHGGRIGLTESPSGGTSAWFEVPDR